ncbi:AraC family transcriptional regulator [Shimia thalassica]|uniref:AraC family transcriptional regulator n=1 Tax=Shimia thalassica TaxID=1715693 RepID=UPI00209150B7|nr:AraC family transcriptional regulator [Shimia thalassica]MDO6480335.1 AraC family transcriptional regulator [Shimia thalassica]MDO6483396.1 AraC family transcriptional regulator [Shimia thalassica]MDO6503521.1 AraC family transcriptional regulator [Shimia thalassica]
MAEKSVHIPSFLTRPPQTGGSQGIHREKPVSAEPSTADHSAIHVMTLAQMTLDGAWHLEQLHMRDHHLLIWITRGQGRLLLHGLRRGFGAHNAIFIPAGKLFAMDTGRHIQGQVLVVPADGRVQLPDRTQQLRMQDGLAQAELTGLFDDVRREIHENRSFLAEALIAEASLMSIWLRRQMQLVGAAPRATAAERIVRRYCDLLADSFHTGKSMASYADELEITPTHLTRVCRQCAGMTAADMLTQMIQHESRMLLKHSDMPINEIASELGFGSAAYFSRFSQQHFGASPSQIRKESPKGFLTAQK